jgi:hypothetical protein
MWLYLPVEVATPNGRMKVRSSLEASLADCREITNRDAQGNVRVGASAGSWLGAVGYLTLVDQIGGAVEHLRAARSPSGGTDFEQAIAHFSALSNDDAVCLYALRNSLAHDFSLVNIPPNTVRQPRKRALTRLFTVTQGTLDLIVRPNGQWEPQNPRSGLGTTVDLKLLGNEVEAMVRKLYRVYTDGNLSIRLTAQNTPTIWGLAHFFVHAA